MEEKNKAGAVVVTDFVEAYEVELTKVLVDKSCDRRLKPATVEEGWIAARPGVPQEVGVAERSRALHDLARRRPNLEILQRLADREFGHRLVRELDLDEAGSLLGERNQCLRLGVECVVEVHSNLALDRTSGKEAAERRESRGAERQAEHEVAAHRTHFSPPR